MTIAQTLPSISHGDHCCLFYDSAEEQARVTAPFLALGLERDERCVYVGADADIEIVREGLRAAGIDVEDEVARDRLIMTSSHDYLDEGHWKTEKMLGFLQQAYDATMAGGFTALRAAGDVAWQVGPDNDFKDVVYYESLLDVFFVGKRMVGLCEYPRHRCPSETLTGILNTHRVAVIGADVCSNFHYLPPELLHDRDEDAREHKRVEWMTSQLARLKRAEEERDRFQRQFYQSQKMEAVGRIAGGVAHDFNNVLTVILGFSQMLLTRADLAPAARDDVAEIRASGERAAALTRQLLAFSRKQPVKPTLVDLNDVVTNMNKFLRRMLRQDVELRTQLDPELASVRIDAGQVEQVLMNLAINASDAMENGGQLTIETANVRLTEDFAREHQGIAAGPYVSLTVRDTGHGMDAATVARVFEPFFTTKEPGKGTGLGLATVYGIVSQAGGTISINSESGKGSEFTVFLPQAEDATEEFQGSDGQATMATRPNRGTETVVLLESDEAVRKLIHRTLADVGYTVLSAYTPDEVLRFCEHHPLGIQLLVTNSVIPKSTGAELSRQARVVRPRLRTLYLVDPTHGDPAITPGETVLAKPFSPEELARKVRETL